MNRYFNESENLEEPKKEIIVDFRNTLELILKFNMLCDIEKPISKIQFNNNNSVEEIVQLKNILKKNFNLNLPWGRPPRNVKKMKSVANTS